jgi:3-oxoacyl-[acyl-carrier-protein] synthase II
MRRRIVITGMGVVTPLGTTIKEMFQNLIAGKSGIGAITRFNAKSFPTTFAAEIKNFDLAKYVKDASPWKDCGVNSCFAAAAAQQALEDAGLLDNPKVDRTRFGVYLGSGEGIQDFNNMISMIARAYNSETRSLDCVKFAAEGLKHFHGGHEAEQELHTTPAHLAQYFCLEGPNFNCLTACAASMIHPFGVTGFNLLTALSTFKGDPTKSSKPFDLNRDGFVLGEGSGMLVIEELEHAKKRGAKIHAELTGYCSTADAFRVTDSHPEGRGAIACIAGAIKDSGVAIEDIGYINAHGTSTQVNDRVETLGIKKVFGDRAYKTPVSSIKSMMGHLIAAAGAVELITCIEAMRTGILPPTTNYETPDPECDLDYIPNKAREHKAKNCLSNSFGFGGQNTSLVVSAFNN